MDDTLTKFGAAIVFNSPLYYLAINQKSLP